MRGTVRGVRGMRGTQKIKKKLKNIFKNMKKYKISENAEIVWLVGFLVWLVGFLSQAAQAHVSRKSQR